MSSDITPNPNLGPDFERLYRANDNPTEQRVRAFIKANDMTARSFGLRVVAPLPPTRLQRCTRFLRWHFDNVFSAYWGMIWVPLAWRVLQVAAGVVFGWGVARWIRGR